nr:hypothetical protein [Tanacetum cinerariifolium]
MRKASLKCPGDGKFVALHEKYVNLFKDPISFEDDGNGDNVGDDDDENGDDDENRDDDGGNVNNDVNGDSEDVNEGDKDPNGSNLRNTTEQGTVVEGNEVEEGEIMSTPENFTQWLEKNVDLIGEVIDSITAEYLYGDLFGDNSATLESMNQEITPEKLPTQKGTPSPKKRVVKASSYLFENIFEAHFGMFVVYGVRLNLETLAPGLCLDANVIDCWGTVLNHEQSFRANGSKSKHFFLTSCISKSMFDGTLASFDAKWESFSNQVNAQCKGNKDGLALGGIDL